MTDKEWKCLVEADCILGGVPGETEEEAEKYLQRNVDTGDLGPVQIRGLQEDND